MNFCDYLTFMLWYHFINWQLTAHLFGWHFLFSLRKKTGIWYLTTGKIKHLQLAGNSRRYLALWWWRAPVSLARYISQAATYRSVNVDLRPSSAKLTQPEGENLPLGWAFTPQKSENSRFRASFMRASSVAGLTRHTSGMRLRNKILQHSMSNFW